MVLVAAVAVLQGYLDGRVGWGTHVGPVPLGGLTRRSAEQAAGAPRTERPAQRPVQTPHGVRAMALDQLGLSVDVPATVEAAEKAGRTAAVGGLSLWVAPGGRVAPVVRVDPPGSRAAWRRCVRRWTCPLATRV